MSKKVLLPCGGGAMGRFAANELLDKGYHVDILDVNEVKIDNPNFRCIVHNGFDRKFMKNLLETEKYDGIIDFMLYDTPQFAERFQMMLNNTEHYVFLSTYRIYANCDEITTEESPRLLDVADDEKYLASEDYSLYKARCENILRASKYDNWTIVRPAITYSQYRYQLVTLEANATISRMLQGKEIVLPKEAMNVDATMSWAGDIGKMYAGLLFNKKAYRETYTLATAEYHPWKYVAECYEELLGAKIRWVDKDDYLRIVGGGEIRNSNKWQLELDRLFDRRMDNSKILELTGLKQEDMMPLKQGLKMMLDEVDLEATYKSGVYDYHMDKYLEERK